MAFAVEAYCAPVWARSLKYVPSSIVKLASLPTPITEWKLPGAPSNFQVLLKRDDFTGSSMTGNKVRKLEFILADALQKGCRHIITTGDSHSNHCRAVAAACAVLGLQSHLLLRTDATDLAEVKYDGNLLLDRLFGAQIYFTPKGMNYKTYTEPRMQQISQKILEETGEKSQVVCIGGSNAIGVWGYIQCFEEIRKQGIEFDDIVCVCGSSGTITGLATANYLCGQPYRCHGILVCGTNKSFHGEIKESLDELGLTDVQSEEIVTLYEDYKYPAYGVNLPEQLEFIVEAATKTGILLDNSYTGKAAYGLSQLLQTRSEVFKGRKILFIHSGDTLSVQTESMASALLPLSTKSRVKFISEALGSD